MANRLTQQVREPTFIQSGNIFYLIWTSELERVEDIEVFNSLPGCLHSPVVCDNFCVAGRRLRTGCNSVSLMKRSLYWYN